MNEALNLGVSRGGNARKRRGGESRRMSHALWLVVAFAIAMPALLIGRAAWAGDVGYLSVGSEIGYGGYSTNYFAVDGEVAYCASPSKGTPPSGTYSLTETGDEAVAAALWYGWGGPGFDASMWPLTWYDGTPLDEAKYTALTHILVADCYSGDGGDAYGQCNAFFQEWCQQNVVGYSINTGAKVNPDALGVKLHERGFGAGSTGVWPQGFSVYMIETQWNTQTIATFRYNAPGAITLAKKPSDDQLVAGNSCYRLDGAVYGVYADESCTNRIGGLVTNEGGAAFLDGIAAGSYWVREEQAPVGYRADGHAHAVVVQRGQCAVVECVEGAGVVADDPLFAKAGLLIEKRDAENGAAQGGATLQGTQFEVEFYDGFYGDADEARASGEPLRSWTVQTDKEGKVLLSDPVGSFIGEDGVEHAYLVRGDEWWADDANEVVFPLGTLVMREVVAPRGYLLPENNEAIVVIDEAFVLPDNEPPLIPTTDFVDRVVRGGVVVEKVDAETKSSQALGAADFEGVAFDVVTLNDDPICIDGMLYERGQTVATIALQGGYAQTEGDMLPIGVYLLQERAAGKGYLAPTSSWAFSVSEANPVVRMSRQSAIGNQVIRGDIAFKKVDEETKASMANVAFRIASVTTGESHVVVSDEEGIVSTAASHAAHTLNTNGNDLVEGGAEYDPLAGVWFGRAADGMATDPRDSLGALPFDTYVIEELPCKGNEGRQLVDSFTVVIGSDGVVVDLGLVEDKTATIATRARGRVGDGELGKVVEPASLLSIVDEVMYANVVPGKGYEMRGWLIDGDTGDILVVGGEEVRGSTTFVANDQFGTAEVELTLDASALDGRKLVVFEQMLCDGRVIAEHRDRFDAAQTILVEKPDEPREPEDSTPPETPEGDPEDPQDSDEPEKPTNPRDPSGTSKKSGGSTVAKTGDNLGSVAMILGGVALACTAGLVARFGFRGGARR